jgi:hypothetical protein
MQTEAQNKRDIETSTPSGISHHEIFKNPSFPLKCGPQDLNRPRAVMHEPRWWWLVVVVPVSWRATIGIVFKSFLASIFDIFHICFYVCVCVCVHGEVYCTLSFSPPSHIRARRIECQMSSIVAVTQCQLPSIPSYIFFFLPPVI